MAKASQPLSVLLAEAQTKLVKDKLILIPASAEVIAEVQALIDFDPNAKSVNAKWQDIQEVFARESIGNPAAMTRPEQCIFHTANRGSLGGNAHDMSKNGEEVLGKGADFKELTKAVNIELCPLEPLRGLQIRFMQDYIPIINTGVCKISHLIIKGIVPIYYKYSDRFACIRIYRYV